jgi:ribosome biogenesis GTPase
MEPIIVINKIDLGEDEYISHFKNIYKSIRYNVFKTSAVTAAGLSELKNFLKGKKNIFIGKSGVGKSSLLNKMYAQLNLQTGEISRQTDRGTHTTVTSVMVNVEENTYVIDTPGIREIDPYGIKKEDLGNYFIEFKEYIPACRFNNCTHQHEPGCAVMDAVEKNKISMERYESYLRLLKTIEEGIIF